MKQKMLLLEDVDGLGRSGDLVTAKPGFIRNFLLPKKKALIADRNVVKLQTRLQEERAKQAAVDRAAGEKLAVVLEQVVIVTVVKVDRDGRLYGSVSQQEIAKLLQSEGYAIERKQILLPHAIKQLGRHTIPLRLQEGVKASVTLEVNSEVAEFALPTSNPTTTA